MSRYEWEQGSIRIPSSEWAKVKQTVREACNRENEAKFKIAVSFYERAAKLLPDLKAQVKSKKIEPWDVEPKLREALGAECGRYLREGVVDEDVSYDVFQKVVVTHDEKTYKKVPPKLRKPLKKDFPVFGNNIGEFQTGDCSLVFDNGTKTARWTVHDNNHAVDRARRSVLGRAFFQALSKITWTRGSGGQIVGNDEYNQESGREYAGGGGSYVTAEYSMEKQKRDREARSRDAYSFSGYRRF